MAKKVKKEKKMKTTDRFTVEQLAKILGLSAETIRKRAAAGTLLGYVGAKNSAGRWEFIVAESFSTPAAVQRTKVLFVVDQSGSMNGLLGNVADCLRSQMSEFAGAENDRNKYEVGFLTFNSTVDRFAGFNLAKSAQTPRMIANGGTALWDAMGQGIDTLIGAMDADKNEATLIIVVTDGEENASSYFKTQASIKKLVDDAGRTGRFTIVVNCPPNSEHHFASMGISQGNIRPWEATVRGVQEMATVSTNSATAYTALRATGQTVSTSYFAQPITSDADKFAQQLNNNMDDVTDRVKVERVTPKDPIVIKDFCAKKFGAFNKGQVYYQLTKPEDVQDYKKVVVQDNATGKFFAGWETARRLLGLPVDQVGTIKIKPGSLGEFKVFVQSTSVNRKLVPGTSVVQL